MHISHALTEIARIKDFAYWSRADSSARRSSHRPSAPQSSGTTFYFMAPLPGLCSATSSPSCRSVCSMTTAGSARGIMNRMAVGRTSSCEGGKVFLPRSSLKFRFGHAARASGWLGPTCVVWGNVARRAAAKVTAPARRAPEPSSSQSVTPKGTDNAPVLLKADLSASQRLAKSLRQSIFL
jgi:hypothetical protein